MGLIDAQTDSQKRLLQRPQTRLRTGHAVTGQHGHANCERRERDEMERDLPFALRLPLLRTTANTDGQPLNRDRTDKDSQTHPDPRTSRNALLRHGQLAILLLRARPTLALPRTLDALQPPLLLSCLPIALRAHNLLRSFAHQRSLELQLARCAFELHETGFPLCELGFEARAVGGGGGEEFGGEGGDVGFWVCVGRSGLGLRGPSLGSRRSVGGSGGGGKGGRCCAFSQECLDGAGADCAQGALAFRICEASELATHLHPNCP
ncbi:hypothetical protein BJY59DRAFT_326298 [Rhodotorula toruloides]